MLMFQVYRQYWQVITEENNVYTYKSVGTVNFFFSLSRFQHNHNFHIRRAHIVSSYIYPQAVVSVTVCVVRFYVVE